MYIHFLKITFIWIHRTLGCLWEVSLKLVQCFWRRFFKTSVVNIFSLFWYFLFLGKDVVLHSNKLDFPSPKNISCLFWLKLPTVILHQIYERCQWLSVSREDNENVNSLQTDEWTDIRWTKGDQNSPYELKSMIHWLNNTNLVAIFLGYLPLLRVPA